MDTTTPSGAAATGVQSQASDYGAQDLEALADGLMDRIQQFDEKNYDTDGKEIPQETTEEPAKADAKSEESEAEKAEDKADDKGEKSEGEEGEEYDSLDAYLTANKVDPESFKQLTVTTKVDGVEKPVSLAELIKDHQLSSASYNRMNELAQERTAFQGEQTQVRQALGLQINRVETLLKAAQEQLMGDYAAVTPQQLADLRARDPGQYAALMQDFNSRQGAIQALVQQADAARREQAQVADNQRRASLATETQKLLAARPDWRDPAKATAAQTAIRTLGKNLGFTDAELNGVFDHRYMLVLDMAARYAQLQASQSATLKRVRSAPRMAKPGTRQLPVDPKVSGYAKARDAFMRNPSDMDAAAAAFEHF